MTASVLLLPLDAAATSSDADIISLFWICVASVLAPLLAALSRQRVPGVVWMLALGVLVGPYGVGLASITGGVDLIREIGMGMLFLMAGYEIPVKLVRARQGRISGLTWAFCFALGSLIALVFVPGLSWHATVALGIAASSTALGTLLPILSDSGEAHTPFGTAVLVHGAVGELFPVLAMSLLLTSASPVQGVVVLCAFVVLTLGVLVIPGKLLRRSQVLGRVIRQGAETTAQTTLRVVVLVLITLMVISALLDLDVVLGAFVAGVLVRAVAPQDAEILEGRLRTLGYSFLIPVFFVTSGMAIDIRAVATRPATFLWFLLTILVARGIPVFLVERFASPSGVRRTWREAGRIGLYAAAGLPIIVAVTGVAVSAGLLSQATASGMVAAGAVSVLVFPLLAQLLVPGARLSRESMREAVRTQQGPSDSSHPRRSARVRRGSAPARRRD